MADDPASSFVFADHLVLDDSPTRDFYRSLLQGLIHKGNNQMGVIQGFASLALMESGIPAGLRENVEQMREAAVDASDLARVILNTAGCARVKVEPVNLPDLLPHLERVAREECGKRGVALQFAARPGLPAVAADSNRLIELLAELIKNAAEAAEAIPGGEVAIDILPPGEATTTDEGRVDFFIRNSSVDLSPEQIREAFLPFHGSKGNGHFGIGLTTAGVLAGQMRMRLGVRNAEGTTTAWLSLPAAT